MNPQERIPGITSTNRKTAETNYFMTLFSHTDLGHECITVAEHLSHSGSTLMLVGEPGTGKRPAAEICYARHEYSDHPLYQIDCTFLDDKSWNFLFYHEHSPFTENGNTLFLSHIETLSPARQQQLLSVIRDTDLHLRNRLIFACSRPPGEKAPAVAIQYTHTLSSILLPTMSLRSQTKQLATMANRYLETICRRNGGQIFHLREDAVRLLENYEYPDNLVQLARILHTAVLTADTPAIPASVIRRILAQEQAVFGSPEPPPAAPAPEDIDLNLTLEEINRRIVRLAVKRAGGNRTAAARQLGISRTTLWRYLSRDGEED